MGRQIRFYMLDEDEKEFFQLVQMNGDFITDNEGNTTIDADYLNKKRMLFIVSPQSWIKKYDFGAIDEDRSEVIQFVRCEILEPGKLDYGRLWIDPNNYDSSRSGNTGPLKSEWFLKKYNSYKKWITKNYKISNDKFGYIGNAAYRAYKEGKLKMMAGGPLVELQFE